MWKPSEEINRMHCGLNVYVVVEFICQTEHTNKVLVEWSK